MNSEKRFFGHPLGLSTLFFTEMWERFSYYGMRAILILFMTTPAARDGLGISVEESAAIYGLYTAAVYLLTLPGGWLADNILGQQKAIWYGGLCILLGHLLLAIPGEKYVFFAGLVCVASGTGLLKPNISTMVGDLYPEGGARRDAGFYLFYMGINIGSFLGQIAVSFAAEKVNWHLGFGLAAAGMLLGLIQFRLRNKTLGETGLRPKAKEKEEYRGDRGSNRLMLLFVLIVIAFIAGLHYFNIIDLATARGIAEAVGVVIVSVTLLYFFYILLAGGLTNAERKRVLVIFFLFIGAALFWAGYEQHGSSFNLFARDYADRIVLGYELPAGSLQSFSPGFVIILAPLFAGLWIRLAARNMNPSMPVKFGIGLLVLALGFVVMYFAALVVTSGQKPNITWLIFSYFLHASGEMAVSPVGLSSVTKLSPKRYVGQMMGIWFVGASLGNLLAGLFAGGFDPHNPREVPGLFLTVIAFTGAAGILFILLNPILKKWMGNVQ
ncbi:MAG TPA: oligopeptide:H+ symporter [Cyclobacteriaceae bacterium]